jgi:hypothetical protein
LEVVLCERTVADHLREKLAQTTLGSEELRRLLEQSLSRPGQMTEAVLDYGVSADRAAREPPKLAR